MANRSDSTLPIPGKEFREDFLTLQFRCNDLALRIGRQSISSPLIDASAALGVAVPCNCSICSLLLALGLCDARSGSRYRRPRLRLTAAEAHSAEPATALKWTLAAKAVGGKTAKEIFRHL